MTRLLPLLLTWFLAPAASAADLWVGPIGSGMPFSELQAAVDFAQPGDRVFAIAGEYGPVTIDKPLTLGGEGSGVVRIVGRADGSGAGVPAVTIRDIPFAGRVLFHGFELVVDDTATIPATRVLELVDCAGGLEIFDLKIFRDKLDATSPGVDGAYVWVERCGRVAASDVRAITGPNSNVALSPVEPFAGLRAVDSKVTFSDSRFDAAYAPLDLAVGGLSGSDAVELVNSELWLGFSIVNGGACGVQGSDPTVRAGDGIDAVNSEVVIHGGRNNGVKGGNAEFIGVPGVAVRADATSRFEYAVDVNLAGGIDPGAASGPAIAAEPGAFVLAHPDRLPTMWVLSPIGDIGTVQPLNLEGDPGATHLWWFGLQTNAPMPVPGLSGEWWLFTPLAILNLPVLIEPSGLALVNLVIPPLPQLYGLMLCYQNIEVDGTNIQIAPPWFAVVEIF